MKCSLLIFLLKINLTVIDEIMPFIYDELEFTKNKLHHKQGDISVFCIFNDILIHERQQIKFNKY